MMTELQPSRYWMTNIPNINTFTVSHNDDDEAVDLREFYFLFCQNLVSGSFDQKIFVDFLTNKSTSSFSSEQQVYSFLQQLYAKLLQ